MVSNGILILRLYDKTPLGGREAYQHIFKEDTPNEKFCLFLDPMDYRFITQILLKHR